MRRIFSLLVASLCGGTLVYGCSGSSGNPASGGDGGSDGSTADVVHKEAAPVADTGGGDDSSASTCPTPADISTWTPPAYVPAKSMPSACAASDITGYDAACLNSASSSQTLCKAFQTAHATCAGCILSKSTDASWGPLVSYGGVVNVNFGGCLELAAPSETACAKAQETAMECPHVACDAVCPVTSGNMASFTQWQACTQTADADACGTYVTKANCLATDMAALSSVCEPASGATFDSLFLQLAPVFCGGGDAGTGDGGTSEGGAADGATDSGATDAPGG